MVPPMAWIRMKFKDQRVWVLADDAGRPVLDRDGRAEMKYRETDPKSYRPGLGNLMPDDGSGEEPKARAPRAASAAKAAKKPARAGSAEAAHAAGAIEIWTDGACSGNPGPMGIGVVVLDGATRKELGEYLGSGTNNIAELVAIERGLEVAAQLTNGDRARAMRIYSDSSYAIGLLDKGWKAKANQELVARIRKAVDAHSRLSFVKVAGHAGVPENERCDELARVAISRGMMR
jgi:ribonuclease HI